MTRSDHPFAPPATLPAALGRVHAYWDGLKRSENSMPFWDDVNLASLPDLSDRLMLIDAFADPQRFRFNSLGASIQERYGANVTGKFMDKIDPTTPFEFFTAQASATVEAKAPTFFRHAHPGPKHGAYARLLLPMWGNGRIDMILGAITTES